ncbi:MAG: ABC transporter permease [Spirochaetaceae bacterium]|nr:ABC transporter permease [Spirochaetaceae bacterium]
MHRLLGSLGEWLIRYLSDSLYAAGYMFEVLKRSFRFLRHRQPKYGYRVLIMQILFTGFEAVWIIAILSLALGAIIILQGRSLLTQFGQGQLVYSILITVITRELGPLLTAFIIIARSGTAMSTEMGNAVVSHEIEAYLSFGINPIGYLIVPRFLGVTISMVILNIYFNIFGLLGSFLVTQFVNPMQLTEYFSNLLSQLTAADVFSSFLKSLIFGAIVGCTATYYGFQVERASTEVPQVAIKAVSRSFVLCILADAILTAVYYI